MNTTTLNGPTVPVTVHTAVADPTAHSALIPGEAIVLDPYFQTINPPLCARELASLEAKLLREGFLIPLVVWQGYNLLLDGYNRYGICMQHAIPFAASAVELPDREAAIEWIIANQLGRRNITRQAENYLRGLRYQELRRSHGGARSSNGASCQNDNLKTADRLGGEYGVSGSTILRDGRYTAQVDNIAANCGHEAKRWILSRDVRLTRDDVERVSKQGPKDQRAFLEKIARDGKPVRSREGAGRRFLVPAEPLALAEKVAQEMGLELGGVVAEALLGKLGVEQALAICANLEALLATRSAGVVEA